MVLDKMDDLDDLDDVDDVLLYERVGGDDRHDRDFYADLSDREFFQHFWFTKEGVERLTGLLEDRLAARHGIQISPATQVTYLTPGYHSSLPPQQ